MTFVEDVPEYLSFQNSAEYNMHSVPNEVWNSLESLIHGTAENADNLKAIINKIAEISGGRITNNWGWGFLENDIPNCVSDLQKKVEGGKKKHFDAFMDSLAVLHDIGGLQTSKINEFLDDFGIGYRAEQATSGKLIWMPVEISGVINDIIETKEKVKLLSQQARERFESALRQYREIHHDERAKKDAVRSCVDAMEALIKELGKDTEIGEATKKLKDSLDVDGNPLWGPVEIVKDGNSIFNLLHKLYPDVRHGTQDIITTEMTMEEADYFVGRITTFMSYIIARATKLGL